MQISVKKLSNERLFDISTQWRIENNPLAWITSTADSAKEPAKRHRTDSAEQQVEPETAAVAAEWSQTTARPASVAKKLTLSNKRVAEPVAPAPEQPERSGANPYYILSVTAKTEEALTRKIQDLSEWLHQDGAHRDLKDMAFTLLVGRSHFNVRAALVVKSREELQQILQQVLLTGQARNLLLQKSKPATPDLQSIELGNRLLAEMASQEPATETAHEQKLLALAEMFVNRYNLNWSQLYDKEDCHRIPMPAYPFAKERYWLPYNDAVRTAPAAPSERQCHAGQLGPLIQRNTSNLHGLRFSTQLRGNEYYLAESPAVSGTLLLGAVFPEMARAAGELAAERAVSRIQQLVWSKPIPVAANEKVHIHLFPIGHVNGGAQAFEAVTGEDAVIHCQGTLFFAATEQAVAGTRVDLPAIRERCRHIISGAEHYRQISQVGSAFQTIVQWQGGEQEALALLELPATLAEDANDYVLHPVLVEGALQTAWRLTEKYDPSTGRMPLPYSAREIEINKPLGRRCYAYATYADGKQRIQWLDEAGQVLADMKDFVGKAIPAKRSVSIEKRQEGEERHSDEVKQMAGGLER